MRSVAEYYAGLTRDNAAEESADDSCDGIKVQYAQIKTVVRFSFAASTVGWRSVGGQLPDCSRTGPLF